MAVLISDKVNVKARNKEVYFIMINKAINQ